MRDGGGEGARKQGSKGESKKAREGGGDGGWDGGRERGSEGGSEGGREPWAIKASPRLPLQMSSGIMMMPRGLDESQRL